MNSDLELRKILNSRIKLAEYISNKTNISDNLLKKLFDIKFNKLDIFMHRVEKDVTLNFLGKLNDETFKYTIEKTLKTHPSYRIINRQLEKQII